MSVSVACVLPILIVAMIVVILAALLPRIAPQGWEDDCTFHYGERKN